MPSIMERFEANRGKSADEAGMYWSGGPVEVASRTWFVSNFSGVTAFETEAGLVLIDSGTERLAPGLTAQLRKHTQAPVHTAIFTHGHLDHAYGLKSFLMPETASPSLKPVYDDPEFIIHNVIRFYGGWWSGRPNELKPAPRAPLAREIATLCGGATTLLARAEALAEAGKMRLAGHLADYALEAAPEDAAVREGVAAIYERRAARETSLMAENLFHAAAASARQVSSRD